MVEKGLRLSAPFLAVDCMLAQTFIFLVVFAPVVSGKCHYPPHFVGRLLYAFRRHVPGKHCRVSIGGGGPDCMTTDEI
jgi:hypothetical protein